MKGGIELSITTLAIIIAVIAIVLLLVAAFQAGLLQTGGTLSNLNCAADCGIAQSRCTDASSGQAPPDWGSSESERKCVQAGYPCKC